MRATDRPLTPPSRRALLTGAAATAGTLCLAACGAGGDSANESTPPSELSLTDVPVGEAVEVATASGEEALLYRADDTELAAFTAVCTHMGGKVTPEGTQLRCHLHNSVFDAATGEPLSGPALKPLPPLDVRVQGDEITVG
ncbi:Rieske (2Fe-2S) protein [Streptomyces xiamenensis]|uniref:Rieske (2Fe-2S) protein n=1 Tax=Streptomyces xiamenensis TaxID=408015 RepID=UPI0037D1446D